MSIAPVFTTPVTEFRRIFPYELQEYPNTVCAKIERRMNDCIDAYGIELSRTKCKDLKDDFLECCFANKRKLRMEVLAAERKRQYKAGERKTRYEEPPQRDLFVWP